jgi:hypothetical protein
MIKEEFAAYPKMRTLVTRLQLSKHEIEESVFFQHFADPPQDLETFVSCIKEASLKGRDFFKEFEAIYDSILRQQTSPAVP